MTITAPRYEGRVAGSGGRYLGVAEFGPPTADQNVVWFHSTPGARRQIPEAARRIARERGVRIIGIDRPGVGLSTSHLYPHLVDFSGDLNTALERLGIDRFSTVGLSGGAPYALACAHAFSMRVPTVGILGGGSCRAAARRAPRVGSCDWPRGSSRCCRCSSSPWARCSRASCECRSRSGRRRSTSTRASRPRATVACLPSPTSRRCSSTTSTTAAAMGCEPWPSTPSSSRATGASTCATCSSR